MSSKIIPCLRKGIQSGLAGKESNMDYVDMNNLAERSTNTFKVGFLGL
jgi:hypothetical protein